MKTPLPVISSDEDSVAAIHSGSLRLLSRQESFASLHILTRRASEGSEALPSLARRVRMSFFGARVIIRELAVPCHPAPLDWSGGHSISRCAMSERGGERPDAASEMPGRWNASGVNAARFPMPYVAH
jgi:hypothetical protein